MPAGCEFFCDNEDCAHYKSGFAIISVWPLGEINKVIDAKNVVKMEDFRDGLLKHKAEGRKYACITYPNVNEIETLGYRINKFCYNCNTILEYDVLLKDGATTYEEALDKSDVSNNCMNCNGESSAFDDVIEKGIDCPHCKQKMQSSRWFSNETTEES